MRDLSDWEIKNMDLSEEIEDAVRQIEALPRSLWSPALRAEWEELVESAARTLIELREMGLVRISLDADGYIAAEMLDRVRH